MNLWGVVDDFVELVHAIVDKKGCNWLCIKNNDMECMGQNIVELRKENSVVGNYLGHES